ncbi:MAG: tetratricopeptide repeat protein [Deltaproteobacteria bacterium]|nr:tetratricopeptide repeat protein [Deltaproteobacteria bacterium]
MRKYRQRTARILSAVLACGLLALGLSSFARDLNDLLFEGVDFDYRGEVEKATASFEQALAVDPKNEYALTKLGILYFKQKMIEKSMDAFTKAVDVDPRNVEAQIWVGILHMKNDELEKAHQAFEGVIRIDPNNAAAYYYLGTLYNFRRNRVKAIELLKKSSDADSMEPDTHFRLAQAFDLAGMVHNALLEYERALDLNPRHTKALNAMGWIHYNQGEVAKAIELWKRSLSENAADRDAALNLAKAYNSLAKQELDAGRKDAARTYWQKTLEVDEGNKAAKYYLKRYN